NNKDYGEVVSRIIERYGDESVVAELKRLASEKPSLINKLFFGYTKERLGLKDYQELLDIRRAIANTER
ncbi:MAG: hypothetical protein Q8N81_00225, partial [bacterium]|nr:hypothetical protein [bacterium]